MPSISELLTTTRASTGTYFDAAGVMHTAPINTWRRDHDPLTGAGRGVLIEEARTNQYSWSQDMANPVWVKTSTSVSAGIGPDGQSSNCVIVENTANGEHGLSGHNITVSNGTETVLTETVFLSKLSGSRNIELQFVRGSYLGGLSLRLDFENLSATTLPSFGTGVRAVSASIVPVGGGVFRVSFTVGATGSSPTDYLFCRIRMLDGTSATYQGDGNSSIMVWGRDRQIGASPTSYIPTTTAAATRAADGLSAPVGPWYNQAQGTLLVDFTVTPAADVDLFNLSDAISSTSNRINILHAATGHLYARVFAGGVQTASMTLGDNVSAPVGSRQRVAFAFKANDFAAARNGTLVGSVSSGAMDTGVTRLNIGSFQGSSRHWGDHIENVQYWPRRLSNAELQAASALS